MSVEGVTYDQQGLRGLVFEPNRFVCRIVVWCDDTRGPLVKHTQFMLPCGDFSAYRGSHAS